MEFSNNTESSDEQVRDISQPKTQPHDRQLHATKENGSSHHSDDSSHGTGKSQEVVYELKGFQDLHIKPEQTQTSNPVPPQSAVSQPTKTVKQTDYPHFSQNTLAYPQVLSPNAMPLNNYSQVPTSPLPHGLNDITGQPMQFSGPAALFSPSMTPHLSSLDANPTNSPPHLKSSLPVCAFFLQGSCMLGEKCPNLHVGPNGSLSNFKLQPTPASMIQPSLSFLSDDGQPQHFNLAESSWPDHSVNANYGEVLNSREQNSQNEVKVSRGGENVKDANPLNNTPPQQPPNSQYQPVQAQGNYWISPGPYPVPYPSAPMTAGVMPPAHMSMAPAMWIGPPPGMASGMPGHSAVRWAMPGPTPPYMPAPPMATYAPQPPAYHGMAQPGRPKTDLSQVKKLPVKRSQIAREVEKMSSVHQCVGRMKLFCKDQVGCRFLQDCLETNDPKVVDVVFAELYDDLAELMQDPFGNYLCQKLIEQCTDEQKLMIIEMISSSLVEISLNMHGTRAAQKLIEHLSSPTQIKLVFVALQAHFVTLIKDINGNHVIQRCLQKFPLKDQQFIYDAVAENLVEIATHRHGCCVLQRCIDCASTSQKIQLIAEITANALTLVQNDFGNYVVQYTLEMGWENVSRDVIGRFVGHIPELSMQKFSSNVIEKCLHVADQHTTTTLINEILDDVWLPRLLPDPFANYVVQTAMDVATPELRRHIAETIKPHILLLHNAPFARRLQAKVHKELNGSSSKPFSNGRSKDAQAMNVPVPATNAPMWINGQLMMPMGASAQYIPPANQNADQRLL